MRASRSCCWTAGTQHFVEGEEWADFVTLRDAVTKIQHPTKGSILATCERLSDEDARRLAVRIVELNDRVAELYYGHSALAGALAK